MLCLFIKCIKIRKFVEETFCFFNLETSQFRRQPPIFKWFIEKGVFLIIKIIFLEYGISYSDAE